MQGISADGYGIRRTRLDGGSEVQQIVARGGGKSLPVTAFSSSVRQSDRSRFDVFSGKQIDQFNDLNAYLGTSATHPTRGTVTTSGTIEDSQFLGSRDVGTIKAYRILVRNPVVVDPNTLIQRVTTPGDPLYPMRISFEGSIGTIQTADTINGLSLDAGTLSQLITGNDVANATFNVGSHIKKMTIGGGLLGTSDVEVTGIDGTGIDSLTTRRSLSATINVQAGNVGTVKVGTDFGTKNFYVQGSVKTLQVTGSVVTGSHVLVRHTLHDLIIGGDLQANATITARAIGEQTIDGQVLGTIAIK